MKLCLGTVQLGMRYGIQDAGQPNHEDCIRILDYAMRNGVDCLDTAAAYGTAEKVVGEAIRRRIVPREKVHICSKLTSGLAEATGVDECERVILADIRKSLRRLSTDYLDACLLHRAEYAYRPDALEALARLRRRGIIRHSGVSVYEPSEAQACLDSPWVDMIQVPASIFDQRMQKAGIFRQVSQRTDFAVHVRSAFVQGLLLMHPEDVPEEIANGGARLAVQKLKGLCVAHGVTRMQIAIHALKQIKGVSHLVFGIDNLQQLKQYIDEFNREVDSSLIHEIAREFQNLEPTIYLPNTWYKATPRS